jgi:23S rRNA (guanosine2251-2'-O)-methyltransferase
LNKNIMTQQQDSEAYKAKKRFFDSLMTVYGRKTVLEALQDKSVVIFRLHLASSNKSADILDEIISLAKQKGAEVVYHERSALSRISKNANQDQGVAADLQLPGYTTAEHFLERPLQKKQRFLALDGVTNPQNLGMIIRSACAGNIDGILLPLKGNAQIDPLVIKASAGTLFRAPLIRCQNLSNTMEKFIDAGAVACSLSSHAETTLSEFQADTACIYVLGNETSGVSDEVSRLCSARVRIPMNNGVESLNVAVTAALIAFRGLV